MKILSYIRRMVLGSVAKAVVYALLLLCSQGVVHGFTSDPKEIDLTTVYRFGGYEVSRYLLEKNYNLFSETKIRTTGQPPTAEEKRDWFELFVAQQALIAELRGQGYDKKPEVERIVRSMESYMLSSEDGPLYEALMREQGAGTTEFQEELGNSRVVFDGIVVRFPEGAEETGDFASELGSLSDTEKRSRLKDTVRGGSANGWDGELVWPYNPYLDVRGRLANCVPGEVHGPVHSDLGVYYFYKRKQVEREVAMLPTNEAQSMRLLEKINRDIFIQSRRGRILNSANVRIDQVLAISLLNSFPLDTRRLPEIDETSLTVDPEALLVVYNRGKGEGAVNLSVSEFCGYYNARMMRSIPGGLEDLKALVYDRVLLDFNRREAERLGVLDDPRFVENRRNFENGQILSHYIEHELAERLGVSKKAVEAYYAENKKQFSRPDVIEGSLAFFSTEEKALAFLSGQTGSEVESLTMVVRADAAFNPFPLPLDVVMTLPVGQPLGPFGYEGGFAVFRKVKELSNAPLPFEKMEAGIRRDLAQRKADDIMKSRFASRAAEDGFQELLDYSRYGVASPFALLVRESDGPSVRIDARDSNSPAENGSQP